MDSPAAGLPEDVPLVALRRGPVVESVHRGRLVFCDPAGTVLDATGDPDAYVYPRSSHKPFQAPPPLPPRPPHPPRPPRLRLPPLISQALPGAPPHPLRRRRRLRPHGRGAGRSLRLPQRRGAAPVRRSLPAGEGAPDGGRTPERRPSADARPRRAEARTRP